VYYVINFVIFQAPTLSHIVDTRINNSIFFQKKAFEIIQGASDILYARQSTWVNDSAEQEAIEEGSYLGQAAEATGNSSYAMS